MLPGGLEEKISNLLIPKVTGCAIDDNSSRLLLETLEAKHKRYVVANAHIDITGQKEHDCDADAKGPLCHRLTVMLSLFLKGYESALSLLGLVTDILGDGLMIDDLGLKSPYTQVKIATVDLLAPTSMPSSKPTMRATSSSSMNPGNLSYVPGKLSVRSNGLLLSEGLATRIIARAGQ